MNRLLSLCVCSFIAFAILLALLLLGSRMTERPMDAATGIVLAATIAPLMGWRFEQLMLEIANDVFQHGGRRMATLPGPLMGSTVQALARLSPGDFSILVMAIRHDDREPMHMLTAPGSDNHRVWNSLVQLGLMRELACEPELSERLSYRPHRYYLTRKGRKLVPALLHAAAEIRRAAPELA